MSLSSSGEWMGPWRSLREPNMRNTEPAAALIPKINGRGQGKEELHRGGDCQRSVGLTCALSCAALAQSAPAAFPQPASAQHKWALVLHGGAGVIERSSMTPEAEANYRAGLKEALIAAADVLDKGGSALDAVETAIKLLEDNPLVQRRTWRGFRGRWHQPA